MTITDLNERREWTFGEGVMTNTNPTRDLKLRKLKGVRKEVVFLIIGPDEKE